MNWFGKKKTTASTTAKGSSGGAANPANTIVKLRENINTQEKREVFTQRKIDNQIKQAKEKMAKGDKKGALFAMKHKKLYESELDKIQNVRMTLETQVITLESAAQNAETFKAMNAGKNAIGKLNSETGIDKVDDLMEDIAEEMQSANDISGAMATGIDPLADDDDLLAELEQMGADDLEAELLAAPSTKVDLPSAPNSKLPAVNAEAEEMRKLEAELAGL